MVGMLTAVLASTATAQTKIIAGTVHFVGPRTPVGGAEVFITGTTYGAYTDSLGRFIIRGLPHQSLRVAVRGPGIATFDTLVVGERDAVVALSVDRDTSARVEVKAVAERHTTYPVRVRGSRGGATAMGPGIGRTVRVVARDSCTNDAIPGALAHLLGTGVAAFTDSAGVFTLQGASNGALPFGVAGAGYRTVDVTVSAGGDTTVTALLASSRAMGPGCRTRGIDLPPGGILHTTVVRTRTIWGFVRNSCTHEPLASASVYIAGTKIGTQSNALGHFRLRDAPDDSVRVIALRGGLLADSVWLPASRETMSMSLRPELAIGARGVPAPCRS